MMAPFTPGHDSAERSTGLGTHGLAASDPQVAARTNNDDRAKRLHGQKSPVTGCQEIGLPIDGRLEKLVVVGVATRLNSLDNRDVGREFRQCGQELLAQIARDVSGKLWTPQNLPELGEGVVRNEQFAAL